MKKVWKNVFASALPQIMNIISNLILPSLIIAKFGSEINGLVTSTKTIISYIQVKFMGRRHILQYQKIRLLYFNMEIKPMALIL